MSEGQGRDTGGTALGLFRSAWKISRTSLTSPLCPDECLNRLKSDLGASIFMSGVGPVVGRVNGGSATLVRRIRYGNGFRTYVRARIRETALGGTSIDCVAGMHAWPRVFMTVWFAFILVWWVGAVAATLATPTPMAWLFWLVPVPMLGFGFALVVGGRYLARNDETLILSYLRRRLEAA